MPIAAAGAGELKRRLLAHDFLIVSDAAARVLHYGRMASRAGDRTVGAFRDAVRAPLWWTKRHGVSGPLAPVALLFALLLMAIAAASMFISDGRTRDAATALGSVVAAAAVDAWLVKQMRAARDVDA